MIAWQDVYSKNSILSFAENDGTASFRTLRELKNFLDAIHIRHCLVRPYQETENYPVVEPRSLLPSFENDLFEYHNLPGFSLVAMARKLDYFAEGFQYDKLHPVFPPPGANCCPLENHVYEQNLRTLAGRLPKMHQEKLYSEHAHLDATVLENYEGLLPYLLKMDRAQVLALDQDQLFHLAGVFASFPSDLDSELKRFGMRTGKFVNGDSDMYERNRMFVYQYFMELYGFPIASERRTSAALFARKLHRAGENFLLRVLGQSDRTLTTYISNGENRRYPRVEKTALLAIDHNQTDIIRMIHERGFFLDPEKLVVIIRVSYRQHRYDPTNLRQDRALSIAAQEIIHPLTGEALGGINVVKDDSNMFLQLNDIVRGEYTGRILFKRSEIVENTETDEKRLKFIYNWLLKHQRRMIGYSDEFFNNIMKVLSSYLNSSQKTEIFDSLRDLYQDVQGRLSYINQARRVRALQDLSLRRRDGKKIGYHRLCLETALLLNELKFEIVKFFPDLVDAIIANVEKILHDSYLRRVYITPPESSLTAHGLEIRKNYGRIVAVLDSIKSVRKARLRSQAKQKGSAE